MPSSQIHLSQVIYNAATRSFEGKATIREGGQTYSYACEIQAPITMTFEDAAKGLSTQAMRRHNGRGGLRSTTQMQLSHARAGRPRFDPVRWLEMLINRPDTNAA